MIRASTVFVLCVLVTANPKILALHMRKLFPLMDSASSFFFLLLEAGSCHSFGHRQRRSLKDSFSAVVPAPWCTVVFQAQFSFACMSETTPL